MADLQADFKIIPVGTSQAGGWRYSFVYDLVHRHYPELPEQARLIKEDDARLRLIELFLHSVGGIPRKDLPKLFRWPKKDLETALDKLAETSIIQRHLHIKGQTEEWIALSELL